MQSLIWCYDPKSTWCVVMYPSISTSTICNLLFVFLQSLFWVARYRMEASKASTMRMVMFTELGIECSYTVEASLAGAQGRHFGIEDLVRMGSDLGRW